MPRGRKRRRARHPSAAPGGGKGAARASDGAPASPASPAPSRSEARDAAARASLEPLEAGERPNAVTVAAIVAGSLSVANLVTLVYSLVSGADARPAAIAFQVIVTVVLGMAAVGMWRTRYWAVLGMQALLGLQIVPGAIYLLVRGGVNLESLGVVVIVLACGTLFWFLVKAMARIQMPSSA